MLVTFLLNTWNVEHFYGLERSALLDKASDEVFTCKL